MKRYNPSEIEPKWQATWLEQKTFEAQVDDSRVKKYVAGMFPYPSGAGLHVGHARNYVIVDTIARFNRQLGHNVINPIGWDTFGLPAENYAIKTGVAPAESTKTNIANFKTQLSKLGMSYDWSREINTSDPEYYKWTQWIFTKMFERDLAYQKVSMQWWCPVDKTVLANEQVEGGHCWRCGSIVEKKSMKQWFFRITAYAEQLLDELDDLDWPENIKTQQRNWIGKSVGAEIEFKVDGHDDIVTVFSTRPDTLFGVTFLVLAPEHPLVNDLVTNEFKEAIDDYVKTAVKKSEVDRMNDTHEKTGVFTGTYAINPINGEKMPIWVADYVLSGYGTGAIMAVPAHDERDFAFAEKYRLPIVAVVEPTFGEAQPDETHKVGVNVIVHNPKTDEVIVLDWGPRQERFGGKMLIGGGVEQGEDIVETAIREIAEETGYTDVRLIAKSDIVGHGHFYSNVKDKNFSIDAHGLHFELVSDAQQATNLDEGEKDKFQVTWQPASQVAAQLDDGIHKYFFETLIEGKSYHGEGVLINSGRFNGKSTSEAREEIVAWLEQEKTGRSKISYKMRDWLISRQRYWGAPIPVAFDKNGKAHSIPDNQLPVLLPEVKDFAPDGSGEGVLARNEDFRTVMINGEEMTRETDTMDGYACSSWYLLRYADPHNAKQPWDPELANYWAPVDYYCGGDHAVAHLLYVRFWTHVFKDMGLTDFNEPVKKLVYNGYINATDGRKMSKSLGNTIDPIELIDAGYGADALRVYEMFIAPYELGTLWDPRGVPGTHRFLNRIWTLTQEYLAGDKLVTKNDVAVIRLQNKVTRKVTDDLQRLSFNTAVSALMEFTNDLYKLKVDGFSDVAWGEALGTLVRLVGPFAPHIASELWQELGHETTLETAGWPEWDDALIVDETLTIIVQVNGKLRAKLEVAKDASESEIRGLALANENVLTFVADKKPAKIIYIPGRLVNIVV